MVELFSSPLNTFNGDFMRLIIYFSFFLFTLFARSENLLSLKEVSGLVSPETTECRFIKDSMLCANNLGKISCSPLPSKYTLVSASKYAHKNQICLEYKWETIGENPSVGNRGICVKSTDETLKRLYQQYGCPVDDGKESTMRIGN